jgi:hypothetical protein
MLSRALDAGVPAAWVTGDEVYGADPTLRAELETRGIGYVLAVACDHRVRAAGDTYRADALLRRVPARAWQCVSAGRGAKGHRLYDGAFLRLDHRDPSPGGQGQRWLLVRRNPKTRELAFYRCWTPRPVSLATLVRVAGRRWTIDAYQCFAAARSSNSSTTSRTAASRLLGRRVRRRGRESAVAGRDRGRRRGLVPFVALRVADVDFGDDVCRYGGTQRWERGRRSYWGPVIWANIASSAAWSGPTKG